jgi:hypothetical protein
MRWNAQPNVSENFPDFAQLNFPIVNFPKQTLAVLSYHRHKIRTRLGVIVTFQANGSAMVLVLDRMA